jgi:hypothetical protein
VATSDQGRIGWITVATAALCIAGAGSCWVDIPEVFPCRTDAECGDDGAVCMPRRGRVSLCCFPSSEVCDGNDNDCNGTVDDGVPPVPCYEGPAATEDVGICQSGQRFCVGGQMADACLSQILPQSEACNGRDDDCDGQIDEGPVPDDPYNCGTCGNRCPSTFQCRNGGCIPSAESACGDNQDEDEDDLIDCLDPDCDDHSCGVSLHCHDRACIPTNESNCADDFDEDGDELTDCQDTDDCKGRSCAGGTCKPNGTCL